MNVLETIDIHKTFQEGRERVEVLKGISLTVAHVAIARALAGGPPLILADEPTANLDSQVGEQILKVFRDLAKGDNRGLMIVTHDP